MTGFSIGDVDGLYDCSANGSVVWETIEHDGFEQFSLAVQKYSSAASEHENAQIDRARRELRSLRNTLSVSVLPFNHPDLQLVDSLEGLRPLVPVIKGIVGVGDPLGEHFEEALESLSELSDLSDNPLGDRIVELALDVPDGRMAVACPAQRFLQRSITFFAKYAFSHRLDVGTPTELARLPALEALFVLGTPRWYQKDEFVFSAPRAKTIFLMHWNWVNAGALPGRPSIAGGRLGQSNPGLAPSPPEVPRRFVEGSDVAEAIDWIAVRDEGLSDPDFIPEAHTEVDARLFALSGDYGVFLDAESKRQAVLEPDLEADERIRWIPVSDLEGGVHILVRTEGGGDLIRPQADVMLGRRAEFLREKQREWKRELRRAHAELGLGSLCRQLKEQGCEIANSANVRNWTSSDSIKTRDRGHFEAILKVVGLGGDQEFGELWDAMKEIDSAHRKAGRAIAKQLREAVADADVEPLIQTGQMLFELEQGRGGAIRAFRIEDLDSKVHRCPESLLGRPFPLHGSAGPVDGDPGGGSDSEHAGPVDGDPVGELLGQFEGVRKVTGAELVNSRRRLSSAHFSHRIKTAPYAGKSNINAWNGKPRLQRRPGGITHTPRPWYEFEIILPEEERLDSGCPPPGDFTVVTDDGWSFECRRQGDYGKNIRSKPTLLILGKWVKGRLEASGALRTGDLVTDETLDSYGRGDIRFTQIEDESSHWYLDFSVNDAGAA